MQIAVTSRCTSGSIQLPILGLVNSNALGSEPATDIIRNDPWTVAVQQTDWCGGGPVSGQYCDSLHIKAPNSLLISDTMWTPVGPAVLYGCEWRGVRCRCAIASACCPNGCHPHEEIIKWVHWICELTMMIFISAPDWLSHRVTITIPTSPLHQRYMSIMASQNTGNSIVYSPSWG